MRKFILVLVIGFFLSGMLNAQSQTAKPLIIRKAHVKNQKQLDKNLKMEKLNRALMQADRKVNRQPKKNIPVDNSVRIQKNSIKKPTEN